MNEPRSSRKVFVIGDENRETFLALDGTVIKKPRETESLNEAVPFPTWDDARDWQRRLFTDQRRKFNHIYPVVITAQIEPQPGDININLNVYFPQMADLLVVFETARISLEKLDIRQRIAAETKIGNDVLHNVLIPLQFMMAEVRRAYRETPEKLKGGLPTLERGADADIG